MTNNVEPIKIADLDWKKQAAMLSSTLNTPSHGDVYSAARIDPNLSVSPEFFNYVWRLIVEANNNQIYILRQLPDAIMFIRNPSPEAIEFILTNKPRNIRFIPELTVEQQMRAVQQDVTLYLLINNPCAEAIEYANEHLTRARNQHPEIFNWDRFGCRNR